MGFSDPFSDIQAGVRFDGLRADLRAPGFASPGTFPSQRFSRSQGFAPPSPSTALFHAAATPRISRTGTGRKSGTNPAMTKESDLPDTWPEPGGGYDLPRVEVHMRGLQTPV